MITAIRRISLRTRLALLAGFAIAALTISLIVAWRLARATETFALRQADAAVQAAARDLARELQANPNGYETIDQATPAARDGMRPPRPAPPHVEKIFRAYADPFDRISAVTLHRYPTVEGGLYRQGDGMLLGYAGQKASASTSSDLIDLIRSVASQTASSGEPASRLSQIGSDRVIVAAYPAEPATAWAMQRLPYASNVSDWPNLVSLVALALSIIAVSGLALITVRDLRSGVTGIEKGLAELTKDLNRQLTAPNTEELARIALAINELAANLRANIAQRSELEKQLRHSERLSALGRVVAGVAHEVRNPLSAIKLKVQLAQRSSYETEKLNETFGVIRAEIERLDNLVRRLLELGGQKKFEVGPVDVCGLVESRAVFFKDVARNASVVITAKSPSEPMIVEGDENRLSQVVDNVIQNAIDAMPDGGQLTINCESVRRDDNSLWVAVTFADSGHGIAEADQENVFEPFHTGRANGTGLGLSIARAIVEEHGGRLSFVNNEDRGTSFVIELPGSSSDRTRKDPERQ
jgi:signal transduction histidine kinase